MAPKCLHIFSKDEYIKSPFLKFGGAERMRNPTCRYRELLCVVPLPHFVPTCSPTSHPWINPMHQYTCFPESHSAEYKPYLSLWPSQWTKCQYPGGNLIFICKNVFYRWEGTLNHSSQLPQSGWQLWVSQRCFSQDTSLLLESYHCYVARWPSQGQSTQKWCKAQLPQHEPLTASRVWRSPVRAEGPELIRHKSRSRIGI